MTEFRTRKVEKHHYRDYLSRAEQCLASAEAAWTQGHWDACAINAIQSAVSASDAVTAFGLGLRSAGQSHADAVGLFRQTEAQDQSTQDAASRLSRILGAKNTSAYEEKPVKPREAEFLLAEARKLLDFAKSKLPV